MVKDKLNEADLIAKASEHFSGPVSKEDMHSYLENIPYYDFIKGYNGSPIKEKDHPFQGDIDPDILYQIHWVDSDLSNLLLKFSLETEKHIKSILGEIVNGYGKTPDQYLNEKKYSNRSTSAFRKIKDAINVDNDEYFAYAEGKYGCIPAWYTAQHITLGQAINWYARLRPQSKQLFAQKFFETCRLPVSMKAPERLEMLKGFMNYVLEIRNKAAHGSKFLTYHIQENIKYQWISDAGWTSLFKLTPSGAVMPHVINYLTLMILLTDLPIFGMNVYIEFGTFLEINSKNNTALAKQGLDVYKLFGFSPDDQERLLNAVRFKFDQR